MRNFTIELNDQDELSYRGYWIDLNNKECYKDDGMSSNKKFDTKIGMFDWIDTREALIEVGELIGGIR